MHTACNAIAAGVLAMAMLTAAAGEEVAATGPLRVCEENPRYFADASGKPLLLTGSHTWDNLQDMGPTDPPQAFDWEAYLDFLERYHHNFVRLWRWELVKWDTTANRENKLLTCAPHPWARTGPGKARDGKPKFNLEQFDEAYFERLRSRVVAARDRGIYVSIMLFEGWGLQFVPDGWQAHPFHPDNNLNGIGAEVNGEGKGLAIHTLAHPAITALQEAYVRKVIDTVNDLDNVLYEISNENHPPSTEWQYHIINYIKRYETGKPKQHPVGMTFQYRGGRNDTLFKSPADWVSPNPEGGWRDNPPAADGSKVVIADTDHLWGIGGNQQWVWKSFLRGHNPIFMDPYRGVVLGTRYDPRWEPIRRSMGYARRLAERMGLGAVTPRNDLASTRYCLASPGAEYLVYQPQPDQPFTVNLDAGQYQVEWLNPTSGQQVIGGSVDGGAGREFRAPFSGDAVLYVKRRAPEEEASAPEPLGLIPASPIERGFQLKVSPDGRQLVDQNGDPFFWLGDTGWALFSALSEQEAEAYLENRREKGFNVVQCIIAHWSRGDLRASPDGHKPWLDGDPATPNEAYFERIDRILHVAQEKGIVLALLPAWGELVTDRTTLTTANARAYGKWLGTRYKDTPNVVWVLGGDQPPTGCEQVFRELAAGLAEGDGGRHLMTYHPRGGQRSSDYWHEEAWLDFNMMQSGHRADLPNYQMVLGDYARAPTKPTLDGEPRYENIIDGLRQTGPRISAHQVRKAAYNAVLSGALGHTYGCSEVYRFWRPGDDGRWGAEIPWQEAVDLPGALHMGYLKSLMLSRPWHRLRPDLALVLSGSGQGGTYTPAATAEDGMFAYVYVPEYQAITVDLSRIAGSDVDALWYDPRNGQYTSIGRFPNSGLKSFAPPRQAADPDYVLVLESSGPDKTPPSLERVFALPDDDKVVVMFSEPLDQRSATNARNFAIDKGTKVREASLSADGRAVTLATSPLKAGVRHTLAVTKVRDRSPARNAIKGRARMEFGVEAGPLFDAAGLEALYTFQERGGDTIRDVSGADAPLDLRAAEEGAIKWGPEGLSVERPVLVASDGPATRLSEACRASGELTIEAWLKPANLEQGGPARIVTLSADTGSRNFTLGQQAGSYIARLRTTTTSTNGIPELVTAGGEVATEVAHIVYTRGASGLIRLYVNGVVRAAGVAAGDLSNWDAGFRLALANEMTSDRTWLGEYHLVAVYSRALPQAEIAQHYLCGMDASRRLESWRESP
ncbi:MAG: DUF4038 domain-containing protein [Armatimonadota bacterium]